LFLLCSILAIYAMEKHWPIVVVAGLVGLTTATRPVGVALLPVLLLYLWRSSPTLRGFVVRGLVLGPLSCWGLAGYMVYLGMVFGDPLAFAHTQSHWRMRPAASWQEHVQALATLEPVRSIYDPDSPCYWQRMAGDANALFNLDFLNPIYFFFTLSLLLAGMWKRQLTRYEWVLSAGLLLIPYVTRSHEMCMGAMGRFAAAAWPLYLVLGHQLRRLPPELAAALLALSGFFLASYAALFAAGYRFF